jgi:hypothetical protein
MEYDINKIRTLCDRYFDGDTTAEEEQLLREYFNHTKDIPADLRAVKVMMSGMSEAAAMTYSPAVTRPKGIVRKIVWGTISAAAAISLFVALSGREVYGYDADGKAITDPQEALEGTKYLAYLSRLETTIDIAQMITLEMEDNN